VTGKRRGLQCCGCALRRRLCSNACTASAACNIQDVQLEIGPLTKP